MSFAQKILEKYGWKEGDGLGKNSDGIAKPLKANLKFDNAGLGVDKADEFNNHWWDRVFNDAANNVDIKTDGDKISVHVKNKDSVEITTKSYSVRELKKKKHDSYDGFISSARLTNTGNEVKSEDKIEIEDIAVSACRPLTDKELFAACGGRTAHKGARHGLKLSGKLARLEKQESELLEKMKTDASEGKSDSWTVVKCKKKKKDKKADDESQRNEVDSERDPIRDALYIAEYCIKSKKKRKEKKRTEEDLSNGLDSVSLEKDGLNNPLCDASRTIKKKKDKKSKRQKSVDNWGTYREQSADNEDEEGKEQTDSRNVAANDDEIPPATDENLGRKKKSKKCKHGIDKEAKEAYKKAKKIKKNLKHVTEELERSVMASV